MYASEFKARHGTAWQDELKKLRAGRPAAIGRQSVRSGTARHKRGANVPSVAKFLAACDGCEHRIPRSAKLPNGHCRAIIERTGKECDKGFMAWAMNGRCPSERFDTQTVAVDGRRPNRKE